MHLTFIDFQAAFDSVSKDVIWKICESLGMPEQMIELLKAFYKETFSQVRVKNCLTRTFEIMTGVRQRSVLYPLLFIIAIDWAMKQTGRPHIWPST